MDVHDAKRIQRQIGEVLLRNWDPIGIRDEPEAAPEYDAYVGSVYRLLASNASDRDIAEHLADVEVERLGFRDTQWQMLIPVAHKLQAVYKRWLTERTA